MEHLRRLGGAGPHCIPVHPPRPCPRASRMLVCGPEVAAHASRAALGDAPAALGRAQTPAQCLPPCSRRVRSGWGSSAVAPGQRRVGDDRLDPDSRAGFDPTVVLGTPAPQLGGWARSSAPGAPLRGRGRARDPGLLRRGRSRAASPRSSWPSPVRLDRSARIAIPAGDGPRCYGPGRWPRARPVGTRPGTGRRGVCGRAARGGGGRGRAFAAGGRGSDWVEGARPEGRTGPVPLPRVPPRPVRAPGPAQGRGPSQRPVRPRGGRGVCPPGGPPPAADPARPGRGLHGRFPRFRVRARGATEGVLPWWMTRARAAAGRRRDAWHASDAGSSGDRRIWAVLVAWAEAMEGFLRQAREPITPRPLSARLPTESCSSGEDGGQPGPVKDNPEPFDLSEMKPQCLRGPGGGPGGGREAGP